MPAGVGYGDESLKAMGAMLGGGSAPPMSPPGGGAATAPGMGEGDVVAGLVAENTQLRMLLGLGPNDPLPPVPPPGGEPGAEGAGIPPVGAPPV